MTKKFKIHTNDKTYQKVAEFNKLAPTVLGPLMENGTPEEVNIYMWYEGEDENCKSENVTTTLDELTVNVDKSALLLFL